jgi:hypothetical protein
MGNMMADKKGYILKGIIVYISFLNILVLGLLLSNIKEIVNNFNIFFIILVAVNLFVVIHNAIFLFTNKINKDYKWILVYNFVFSLISGFSFRMFGFFISNNLGPNLSVYFTTNYGGTDYGFRYSLFNMLMQLFPYDNIKYTGFSIQLNLIMLTISTYFLYSYLKLRRNTLTNSDDVLD